MYPSSFDYHAPATVAEVLALLDKHQDDAKVIAGSQSLVPLMKLRLSQPKHLIDLRKLPGMIGVWDAKGALQIGAMTTHDALEKNELLKAKLPMLAEAAGHIGDRQIRNQGTVGGSLAHADPAADWPAVMLACGASVKLVGKGGERTVTIEDFIIGPLTTALEQNELLVQVVVPVPAGRVGAAYEKYPHPASRFALVGVAAVLTLDAGGVVQAARVVIAGMGAKASRATEIEKALVGKKPAAESLKAAAQHASAGLEVTDDSGGSAAYKRQLAAVVAERALVKAAARAGQARA